MVRYTLSWVWRGSLQSDGLVKNSLHGKNLLVHDDNAQLTTTMKLNAKPLLVILIAALLGMVEVANAFYDPGLQRWINRDPIQEKGGINLYTFVKNDAVKWFDTFGRAVGGSIGDNDPCDDCGPHRPPDFDIDSNIQAACDNFRNMLWFRDQVRNRGPWDYKQRGRQYQNLGNFNYGATGSALGIPENIILREAGRAQGAAGTSLPEWGDPGWRINPWGGVPPYGDDPIDQYWIQRGIEYNRRFNNCR